MDLYGTDFNNTVNTYLFPIRAEKQTLSGSTHFFKKFVFKVNNFLRYSTVNNKAELIYLKFQNSPRLFSVMRKPVCRNPVTVPGFHPSLCDLEQAS